MKRLLTIFPLIILSSELCFAQWPDSLKVEILKERNFEGSALYGYMNGGSDLFFSYGFKLLKVQDIKYKGEAFQVEAFMMSDPLNAFGVYSVHTHRCLKADYSLSGEDRPLYFDCLSKYQLQSAAGNKYISIVFHGGTESAAQKAEELMRAVLSQTTLEMPIFPPHIDSLSRPLSGRVRYSEGEWEY